MADIFDMAVTNSPTLRPRLDAMKTSLDDERQRLLEALVEAIRTEGTISINMKQTDLLGFLVSARYENLNEWSKARAARSSKTAEQILAERLGALYPKRAAFERHFSDGELFKYGALNTGGLGATRYGDYCVVLRADFGDSLSRLAYILSDSLVGDYIVGTPAAVDEAALIADLATHETRHLLAGIKCGAVAVNIDSHQWPGVICSSEDYVEAVFIGDVEPQDIATVRMRLVDYEIYADYAYEDFRGTLSRAERTLVELFVMIQNKLDESGVSLTVVGDA